MVLHCAHFLALTAETKRSEGKRVDMDGWRQLEGKE